MVALRARRPGAPFVYGASPPTWTRAPGRGVRHPEYVKVCSRRPPDATDCRGAPNVNAADGGRPGGVRVRCPGWRCPRELIYQGAGWLRAPDGLVREAHVDAEILQLTPRCSNHYRGRRCSRWTRSRMSGRAALLRRPTPSSATSTPSTGRSSATGGTSRHGRKTAPAPPRSGRTASEAASPSSSRHRWSATAEAIDACRASEAETRPLIILGGRSPGRAIPAGGRSRGRATPAGGRSPRAGDPRGLA